MKSRSERRELIVDFMSGVMETVPEDFAGDEVAGFIFEDLMREFDATPEEIIGAAHNMLMWIGVELSIGRTGRLLREKIRDVSPTGGYVYLFKNGHWFKDAQFKIGVSANPEARLSALNRSTPPGSAMTTLEVKFWVDDPKGAERMLHKALAHRRVQSETGGQEWFFLNDEELRWVHETLSGISRQSISKER